MQDTILVTGGAGFIGSCFVAQQVQAGRHVVVLDALAYSGHMENLNWIPQQPGGWQFVRGDIADAGVVRGVLAQYQPSAIVDFAAQTHVDNSIAEPLPFIGTNIIGCYTLLESVREYLQQAPGGRREHFRFLHISTDEVYGSLGAEGVFTEASPMRPNSPYSASKAAADMLCRAWFHTYGLPVIITNCSNNYGPRQFPEKLIPRMVIAALAGEPLPIYGDGKHIRDWIHVEDHCAGIALALDKGKAGETYAFGGNAEMSNIQVVDMICDALDDIRPRADGQSYKQQQTFVADRPGHDRRYAIDDSKAQRELGFKRHFYFEKGLRDTITWYVGNQAWRHAVTTRNP